MCYDVQIKLLQQRRELFLLQKLPESVYVRHLFWAWNVALLLLSCGTDPVSCRRYHGGAGDIAAAALTEVMS